MTSPSKPVPQKDVPRTPERAERLAAALRENLKRRKVQARAQIERQSADRNPAPPEPAGPVDAGRTRG